MQAWGTLPRLASFRLVGLKDELSDEEGEVWHDAGSVAETSASAFHTVTRSHGSSDSLQRLGDERLGPAGWEDAAYGQARGQELHDAPPLSAREMQAAKRARQAPTASSHAIADGQVRLDH
jgi:hypothetical protein